METRLTIRAVAAAVGRSTGTIRRLEKTGVIDAPPRDRNGWRVYTTEHVSKIEKTIYSEKERNA